MANDERGDVGVTGRGDALTVFISSRDSSCEEGGEALGHHAWIALTGEHGALCLACADMDHLVFLPSGDAALTRPARKLSTLTAVVLKWSRARKRYERQGVLIDESALALAEEVDCPRFRGQWTAFALSSETGSSRS